MSNSVRIKSLHPSAKLPVFSSDLAAGADVHACMEEKVEIEAGGRAIVATGLALAIPVGFEAQIRPRSGLAFRHGVTVLNSPGTIDADYRGELKILLINHGRETFVIESGMRIAQMVIARCEQVGFEWAEELDDTKRGEGGFGSTGP